MNLQKLFLFQGIIMLSTFVLIMVSPATIPKSFGIVLAPGQYLLPYLVGANEFALSFLSFRCSNVSDKKVLNLMVVFFIIFHAATGAVCIYAVMQGAPTTIIANVVLRVILVSLLFYYPNVTNPAEI